MTLCQHCQLRPAYQGKRHLCLPCYNRVDIRNQYPAETRLRYKGLCQHCRERQANRPKRLCWSCYYTPDIRDLYPVDSKFAPKGDDHVVTLPILRVYPNLDARVPCGCERGWEGECPHCEKIQRRGMPVVAPPPETADEIIAFVRGLRRACGGVMS